MKVQYWLLLAIFVALISSGIKIHTKTYPDSLKKEIIESCANHKNTTPEKLEKYRQMVSEPLDIALRNQCSCYADGAERMKLALPATYFFGFLLFHKKAMREIASSKELMRECAKSVRLK